MNSRDSHDNAETHGRDRTPQAAGPCPEPSPPPQDNHVLSQWRSRSGKREVFPTDLWSLQVTSVTPLPLVFGIANFSKKVTKKPLRNFEKWSADGSIACSLHDRGIHSLDWSLTAVEVQIWGGAGKAEATKAIWGGAGKAEATALVAVPESQTPSHFHSRTTPPRLSLLKLKQVSPLSLPYDPP